MTSGSHVYLITKMPLSDENRVIVRQTDIELWVSPFLSYELWKLRIELSNLVGQTASKEL